MGKRLFILATFLVSFISCMKKDIIYLYSPNKTKCVSIITLDSIRYVIDGKHSKLPDTNYVKLDVSHIDPLGDGVWVCWDINGYEWDIVVDNSVVIKSSLDSTRFRFKNKLPKNDQGIPTEIKYRKEGCVIYDFHSGDIERY